MDKIYDVVIIGAGPAGLTSALYATRAKLNTLIIEKSTPGGQLINISNIENYPGYTLKDGATLAYNMYEQVTNLNVEFEFDEVIEINQIENIFEIVTINNKFLSKNVIVATGTTYSSLKLSNERKFIGKGISYCAVCDGKFNTNKEIAVFGNSTNAFKEALYLANYASKIYLIIDGIMENNDYTIDIKNNEKFVILENSKITKLIGNETLEKIEINSNTLLDIYSLFPLISSLPSNTFLSKYPIFASNGYMEVDNNFQSNIKGIFGIGDCINKSLRQVITACNDGAIASQYIATHK